MAISLYPHQRDAIDMLDSGNILCGGVGTGKSRTALAYFFEKECLGDLSAPYPLMKKPKNLIIITTARKRDTMEWDLECATFHISRDPTKGDYPNMTTIIDSWNNIDKYIDIKDAFFIFDEQRVVGKGAWVKSFLKIAKCNRWILLSATPGDNWNDYIPVFIANGFYKNRSEFIREHVVYDRYVTKYPKIDHYIHEGVLLRHRRSILVDMAFRKRTIPHNQDYDIPYDRKKYKEMMKSRWNPFTDKPVVNAAELCGLLRRIVNSAPERAELVRNIASEKKRVIIFYNFDFELDILKNIKYNEGTIVAEWNGHKHEKIPKSEKWVYLVQYFAGAEGWNCVDTDTIIFYSQNYSYKIMLQSAGRIDRLNTPFTDLYYYHLKSKAPIDIAIAKALREKRDFNIRTFLS